MMAARRTAQLTLHPRVYRTHLDQPRVLPGVLGQVTAVLLGHDYDWHLSEDDSGQFIDDTDYDVAYPEQGVLLSAEELRLGGAITAAIAALMLGVGQ